ncbi:MAG: acyl-CoA desaturase [Chitinophagales bacterium]
MAIPKVTFNNTSNPFFKALKEKVDGYFIQHQIRQTGNLSVYFKGILQACLTLSLYIILVFFTPGVFVSILLCILLGLSMALVGFNIMHEGGHHSLSKYKWVNIVSVHSLNFFGGSSYFWKLKHNISHHTYTNIEGMDSDIEVGPLMRLHDNQPRYWFHRFQHFYWFVLYGATYISWVFYQDFDKYFTGRITDGMVKQSWSVKEHFIFWISKVFYISLFLLIPVLTVGWIKTLIGFFIIHFFCGLFMAIVFQLAHIVTETQFPNADPTSNKVEQEWALHQIATTANFATKSKLVSWLLGGLNFQVEHHLFPKISHVHYPEISRLVKETCTQFNVRYIEYPSMLKALRAHVIHLQRLGKPGFA